MSDSLKKIAKSKANFMWNDVSIKPIKGNFVFCSGDDYVCTYFVAKWTGKRWLSLHGSPIKSVDEWCYIKSGKHVW